MAFGLAARLDESDDVRREGDAQFGTEGSRQLRIESRRQLAFLRCRFLVTCFPTRLKPVLTAPVYEQEIGKMRS